ncbi:MAG TPA: hypothetical protein VEA44_04355 [Caulobacter sp.]|nr:hypothetical protein [Caulobacter sp.]
MKLYTSKVALALAVAMAASTATAQTTPPGIEGKDWAQTEFTIASGATVEITAANATINTRNGNTTRIILTVNGRTVVDSTFDKAESQVSYRVSGNGSYQASARCMNSNADAYQCSVAVRKVSGKTF